MAGHSLLVSFGVRSAQHPLHHIKRPDFVRKLALLLQRRDDLVAPRFHAVLGGEQIRALSRRCASRSRTVRWPAARSASVEEGRERGRAERERVDQEKRNQSG
jgi:hypothetical protein